MFEHSQHFFVFRFQRKNHSKVTNGFSFINGISFMKEIHRIKKTFTFPSPSLRSTCATLSRRFARQIFTSFLSRKDLTKLKKQKNRFLFFVLVTTRYDRARQSQQKLQFCTLFLYSHKECTHVPKLN